MLINLPVQPPACRARSTRLGWLVDPPPRRLSVQPAEWNAGPPGRLAGRLMCFSGGSGRSPDRPGPAHGSALQGCAVLPPGENWLAVTVPAPATGRPDRDTPAGLHIYPQHLEICVRIQLLFCSSRVRRSLNWRLLIKRQMICFLLWNIRCAFARSS